MHKRILITTQMMIHDQTRFRGWLESERLLVDFRMSKQFLSEKECLEIPAIYDGWIAGDDRITKRVLDHFSPRLKVISKWGTGLDSIDLDYAQKSAVKIRNSPSAFEEAVGEMAVGYLLALTRGIVDTDKELRIGNWPKKQYRTLVGMRVGFVGMGAIGTGAATRLQSLGCDIYFSDPAIAERRPFKKVDIGELFNSMDAIVVTANLTPKTKGLIDKQVFNLIESPIFLINVARGGIVNESDLIEAVNEKKIIGAALDVYETEPLPTISGLRKLPNVILGSHNANNTVCAVEYVHQNTISNLINNLS